MSELGPNRATSEKRLALDLRLEIVPHLCIQPRAWAGITSTLGNLAPLFAVVLLREPLRALQFAGLVLAVAGAVINRGLAVSAIGEARRYCCRLPARCCATRYRRSSSSGSKSGRSAMHPSSREPRWRS